MFTDLDHARRFATWREAFEAALAAKECLYDRPGARCVGQEWVACMGDYRDDTDALVYLGE